MLAHQRTSNRCVSDGKVSQGPEIESAKANEVIIRWTTNNPGGSDEHFGVVHYGKSAKKHPQRSTLAALGLDPLQSGTAEG